MHEPVSPPGPNSAADRFADQFLPRMLSNVVAMCGVALAVFWIVDRDNTQQMALEDSNSAALSALQAENAALQARSQSLAEQVHELGLESEILRWQLRYTEQRLRDPEAAATPVAPIRRLASRALALDPPAAAQQASAVAAIAQAAPEASPGTPDLPQVAPAGLSQSPSRQLDPDDFNAAIPRLDPSHSQLDRDRAYAQWKGVVAEAVRGECNRKLTDAGGYKCSQDVRRDLWSASLPAVECILSGNAIPDYIGMANLDELPSHSVPLTKGAVILCDGALRNL